MKKLLKLVFGKTSKNKKKQVELENEFYPAWKGHEMWDNVNLELYARIRNER